ncbi:MAG: NAD-dependent dehydratase [Candidatus Diapherotrites archaeon CG11_big_fil_rev_8_21_14_0_20_37_9]|nr:MAG: NAD-dependent dehydratase [Candidatus Diapherotrites archaeon CG11_big_fil_rev_8_21_14_0_20_37_9]
MAKIIVAGGAGFIGSHLCDFLITKGEDVVAIDNLVTGNKNNIAHLMDNKKFSFIEQDISKEFSVAFEVKQIYNLASPASPVDYQEKPLETLDAGSLGVRNLLAIAKEKNASLLFASTSEVYGNPLEHPQKETYWGNVNPVGPRSCYDEAKRFGEAYCVSFRKMNNSNVKIARIFNTYGPRMRGNDGRVVPNFINQALAGESITVYGKGDQTRSFCYVDDMVTGLYSLMNSPEKGPVNIGNPVETTILELAQKIISLTKSKSKISFKGLPVDDPERRLPDISLAREKLAWVPKISLENGLKKTIDFFK